MLKKLKDCAVFDFIPDPVVVVDTDGIFLNINKAVEKATGYKKEELIGQPFLKTEIVSSKSKIVFKKNLCKRINGEPFKPYEVELVSKKGQRLFFEINASVCEYPDQTVHIVILRNISKRKVFEEQLRYKAFHDELTGLYNRAFFEEEIKRVDTKRQLPLCLIFGDVNDLKLVNDAFGHLEGDKLLMQAAGILKKACRKEDVVARWGGDEFAILLPRTSDQTTKKICDRVREICAKTRGTPAALSIALGRACKSAERQKISAVIRQAEKRMYEDKRRRAGL